MSAATKLVAEPRFLESLKSLPEPSRQWIQELIGSVDNFESALSKRSVERTLDALGPGMEVVSVRPGCLIYFERKGGGVHLKDLVYLEQPDVQGTASDGGLVTTADQVADWIIHSAHESQSFLSNLKLQKLLYYVQAWHLAIYERPLFPDKFQAWIRGPVIPDVYKRFERFGWKNIDEPVKVTMRDPRTIQFIEEVLEEYGPLDTRLMESLVHQEAPWIEARGDLAPEDPCEAIISEDRMRSFYRARLSKTEQEAFLQQRSAATQDLPEACAQGG